MPRTKRPKPLYQRGDYRLFARDGRPNLEIVWYDAGAGRERSASAGTSDVSSAKLELDRRYLTASGARICAGCGRPMEGEGAPLLTRAIADYLLVKEGSAGEKATRGRLAHVVEYVADTDPAVTCAAIDARWVDGFRAWIAARPVVDRVSKRERPRSLGHVEGCVRQLAAAINATPGQRARFTALQAIEVARSPRFRADVAQIAALFLYCLDPDGRSPRECAVRRGERTELLKFLRAAVATWARPEEIFDIARAQWIAGARVLDLNTPGRRQTRKYRTTVPIPRQFAGHLDDLDGRYMGVSSVRAPWAGARAAAGLPADRAEAGEKLIRRSMATMVRKRIGEAQMRQVEMMLGHAKHTISDIYALPDPANLGLALAATETIIAEIESLAPGAFNRNVTATRPALVAVK